MYTIKIVETQYLSEETSARVNIWYVYVNGLLKAGLSQEPTRGVVQRIIRGMIASRPKSTRA